MCASVSRYSGLVVSVSVEELELPDGTRADFEIVRHPGGAAVVAVDDRHRVCLLRQYRPVIGDWLWELPAGKLEPDESPLGTAQRELADEAGLAAQRWRPLGSILSSPGVYTEVVHLYLATRLSAVEARPEPGEIFECHWLDLRSALDLARDSGIRDAKTLIGLYRAAGVIVA